MITIKIGNDAAIELPTIIDAKRVVHHCMITTNSTVEFKLYTDNLRDLDQYIIGRKAVMCPDPNDPTKGIIKYLK